MSSSEKEIILLSSQFIHMQSYDKDLSYSENRRLGDYESRTTWATCSLRKWLNGYFYDNCFTDTEKSYLIKGSDGGLGSLLSASEAKEYLTSKDIAISQCSIYAQNNAGYNSDCDSWWLRSSEGEKCAYVNANGTIVAEGKTPFLISVEYGLLYIGFDNN